MLGFHPGNLALYEVALSHRSSKEKFLESNERLEYLGDAILGAIIGDYLFKKYPYKTEGYLTEMRSKIVNRQQLNDIAIKMGLRKLTIYDKYNSFLKISQIFGNTLEALVGAVYLDRGYNQTKQFVHKRILVPYIDLEALDAIEMHAPIRPSALALHTAQQRTREKTFLADRGFPTAPFAQAGTFDELWDAVARIGTPSVVKTAAFGYDGKGQRKLEGGEDPAEVWATFDADRAVLEAFIPFERELSVMVARSADGTVVAYDPAENRHRHHILDVSIVPARVSPAVAAEAKIIACQVADALDYHGIMGVEFSTCPMARCW